MYRWKIDLEKPQNKSAMDEHLTEDLDVVQEYEKYFQQEHQHLIESANNEFGVDGWSHSIIKQEIDCLDVTEDRCDVGVSILIRVELKSGTHHDGLGYGTCHGKKSKSVSILIAKKEALLNGLRCALQCFYKVLARPDSKVPVLKDNKISRMIIAKAGLDEVDCDSTEQKLPVSALRDSPGMNQSCSRNGVFWKKTKLASDVNLDPQKAELESSNDTKTKSPLSNFRSPPAHLSIASVNDSGEDEGRKLERKRKQRQKQEEFRLRLKLNQSDKDVVQSNRLLPNSKSGERGKMDELIETLDTTEASFISTQELNDMIQTTTVHSKSGGPLNRVPLLSSPP